MQLFTVVWKNVHRRRARSLLTVSSLGTAVATVVALLGISESFERHFMDLYAARGIDLVVQRSGANAELNVSMQESLGDRMRKLPHVTAVIGGLLDEVPLEQYNLPAVFIDGWPADSPLFDELTYIHGRRLRTGDFHKLIIGRQLAANIGTKVGDSLQIYGDKYQVIAIYSSKNVYDDGSMVTLLPDMQAALNRPHQVTGFIIRTDLPKDIGPRRSAELATIKRQIDGLDHGIDAEATANFVRNVGPIRASRAFAWAVSAIALLLGSIEMLNAMVMSVFERIREIGTLRAIGWRKTRVVRMILLEALLLSIVGAAVGSLGAIGLTHCLSHMPSASGLVAGDIAPAVVVEGWMAAVLVGVASSLYPAWWGATVSPQEAMRRA